MTGWLRRLAGRIKSEREELWRVIEVTRLGLRRIWQSGLPRMAAALSYRTIFSLIPVLVVAVVVIGSFASEDQLRAQVDRLVSFAGLDTIVVDDPPAPDEVGFDKKDDDQESTDGNAEASPEDQPPGDADRDGVIESTETPIALSGDPDAGGSGAEQRLDEWITDLVTRVSGIPFGALGVVGVAFLVYAALSMLMELERAFNQIYGAPRSRSLAQMVAVYWTALTLGVVFLLGTFYAGDAVANWATSLGAERAADGTTNGSGFVSRQLLEVLINLVINISLLLFVYTTVPNTRVAVRPALAGAAISGVAWELGKWGFTLYVKNFTGGLEQLYGAIAIIPLFLLWVYVTWIIVLFGLQVSHAVQTFSTWSATATETDDTPRLADPALILPVAVAVAKRFGRGETTRAADLTPDIGGDERIVRLLLDRLCDAGITRRVDDGADPDAYTLSMPADAISASRVLGAGESLAHTAGPAARLMNELAIARRAALAERSLADIAQTGLDPTPQPDPDTPPSGAPATA